MKILETARLVVRHLDINDAAFIMELVNEPSWIRFIGDRQIKTLEDACNYLIKGPLQMYQQFGFGLYAVELKESGAVIGICGLIKRDSLEDVDIGFAFLPRYWGKGYARESAAEVMAYGISNFGLKRIVAITSSENARSIKVLEDIGMRFEEILTLGHGPGETRLFAYDL